MIPSFGTFYRARFAPESRRAGWIQRFSIYHEGVGGHSHTYTYMHIYIYIYMYIYIYRYNVSL